MKMIWDYISVKGRSELTNKQLILATVSTIGIFHVIMAAFFGAFGMWLMLFSNVVSVLIYIGCGIAIKNGYKLRNVFNIMYVEIVLHAVGSTMMVGLDSGFMLYLIAMIPLGYYVTYNLKEEKDYINPMGYVILAVWAFLSTRVASRFIAPIYSFDNVIIDRAVYLVNYIFVVLGTVAFCSTLLRQIKNLEAIQQVQNEKLEELSKVDPLTGLFNRRCIQEQCDNMESSDACYAVILGDIDDFKIINDSYGHNVGDEVLKIVARIFKSVTRGNDIVCRWGGEEILVFLPEANKEQAEAVADRVLNKIREAEIEAENKERFGFTMTMGVATGDAADSFKNIVKQADDRLYKGKRAGKNRVVSE